MSAARLDPGSITNLLAQLRDRDDSYGFEPSVHDFSAYAPKRSRLTPEALGAAQDSVTPNGSRLAQIQAMQADVDRLLKRDRAPQALAAEPQNENREERSGQREASYAADYSTEAGAAVESPTPKSTRMKASEGTLIRDESVFMEKIVSRVVKVLREEIQQVVLDNSRIDPDFSRGMKHGFHRTQRPYAEPGYIQTADLRSEGRGMELVHPRNRSGFEKYMQSYVRRAADMIEASLYSNYSVDMIGDWSESSHRLRSMLFANFDVVLSALEMVPVSASSIVLTLPHILELLEQPQVFPLSESELKIAATFVHNLRKFCRSHEPVSLLEKINDVNEKIDLLLTPGTDHPAEPRPYRAPRPARILQSEARYQSESTDESLSNARRRRQAELQAMRQRRSGADQFVWSALKRSGEMLAPHARVIIAVIALAGVSSFFLDWTDAKVLGRNLVAINQLFRPSNQNPVALNLSNGEQQSRDLRGSLPTGGSSGASLRDAYFNSSSAPTDSKAQYLTAMRRLSRATRYEDASEVLNVITKLSNAGFYPATFSAGLMLEQGLGAQADPLKAAELYEKAATGGNVMAMHNLAILKANDSRQGQPDYKSAIQWFVKGAHMGDRDSQYNLAIMAAKGLGMPIDLAQAWAWFSVAAGQGDSDAARKRDEVKNYMSSNDLERANAFLASFKPIKPNEFANL